MEVHLTDDLDGSEAAETVRFSLDGRQFEIDPNDKNAAKLRKALAPYVAGGCRLGTRTGISRRTAVSAGTSGMTKGELNNVRTWARANGYEV